MTASTPAVQSAQANRGTIFVEEANIIGVRTFPGDQYILRISAPKTASRALPGSFVHIRCDEAIPMRRPLSIMRTNPDEEWIEVLFKVVGDGLKALGARSVGDQINIIGPIGRGFSVSPERSRPLLIGGGVGIPPMVFLIEHLLKDEHGWQPLVIMGSEIPFPFQLTHSDIPTPWLPAGTVSTMPLMEQWRVPCRLASLSDFEGTYRGYVTDLAREWLVTLSPAELGEVEVFACGPTPMLEAVAKLAREFGLPCQVSLEEFMACAVGGCAGCTVLVHTDDGPAMKRVCVDGPVFAAESVFAE